MTKLVKDYEPIAELIYEAASNAFEHWSLRSPGRDELEAALLAAEPLIRASVVESLIRIVELTVARLHAGTLAESEPGDPLRSIACEALDDLAQTLREEMK